MLPEVNTIVYASSLGNHTHSGRHSHTTAQIVRDSKVPVLVVPNE